MSSSRSGKPSRRIIVLSAGLGLAAAVLLHVGVEAVTGTRYPGGCSRIAQDAVTTWRISYSAGQCVVMVNPVPVDSDSASLAATPNLLNREEIFRALVNSIGDQSAEDSGEAVAIAHFLVDETGVVREQRISESSGNEVLDETLLTVASLSSFSPAEDEEGATQAWVAFKVGFRTNQGVLRRLQQQLKRWRGEAEM